MAGILNSQTHKILLCVRESKIRRDTEKCVSVEPAAILLQHQGNTFKLRNRRLIQYNIKSIRDMKYKR